MKIALSALVLLASSFAFANTTNEMTLPSPQEPLANLTQGHLQIGWLFLQSERISLLLFR